MLTLAAVLPLLLSGGWIAAYYAQQTGVRIRQAASDTVARAAERITAELLGQVQVAEALAASTALDKADLEAFRKQAERLLALQPLWLTIELTSPSGIQLVNLLRPEGEALGPTADFDSFRKVTDSLRPVVGGIGPVGQISGRRLVTVRVPVLRNGALRYVLSFAVASDNVAAILRTAGAPASWVGVVVDGSGFTIARTINEGPQSGKLASATLRNAVAQANAGTYVGRTAEGIPVDTDYRTLPPPVGWTVAFGIPSRLLEVPVRRALYILGGAGGAGLGLAAMLASLVARDLAQRRRDEGDRATRALGASQQLQVLALEAADLGAWRWDIIGDRFDGSIRCRVLLGLPAYPLDSPQEGWRDAICRVHPDDQPLLQSAIDRCRAGQGPLQCEFRVTEASKGEKWVRVDGRLQRSAAGKPSTLQGVIGDISVRRQAEVAHVSLLRQLAQAQEDERRRISRELHDQVGQTVTGLSFGLKAMEDALEVSPDGHSSRKRLQWLRSLTDEIGREIHRTASDLRPTALDDFGLYRAVETFIARWTERSGVNVDLQAIGTVGRLSPEIETTLYRIVQEALNNVFKHAHARNVSVLLERGDGQLRVIVEDDGVGFDPALVQQDAISPHLGLSGIRERLSPVGGTMTIESSAASGTTLFVQVPIQSAEKATGA